MKRLFVLLFIINTIVPIAAQQNWAAIPCSKMKNIEAIHKMLVDSLHNEIILYSLNSKKICNTNYKSVFAYNGINFHDLDRGLNTHDFNTNTGAVVWDCITYGNKTVFGGGFSSVGSNTLYAKSIAQWNGAVWDTFPTHCFSNALNGSGGGFYGFLKHNGKLWMYGGFDTIGGIVSKNLATYDGANFTPVPAIPVNNNSPITKMIVYQNKLIATGTFYDYPSFYMFRLAQFDGTTWTPIGNGVQGALSANNDMEVYKDTLYIAGAFPKSAGNAGNYIMKWDGTQLMDAGFGNIFCGYGAIRELLTFKNRLYAFGNFDCAANQKSFGVAYYENGTWTVPQDSIENWSITSAVVYNNSIYISGGFKSINGDTTIQKFAKLVCPDFDAASGCLSGLRESSKKLDVKIFPNPTYDKVHIEFEQSNAIAKISIINTLGQEVYRLIKPQSNQEIDISQLPTGIYFLKAENKEGYGVSKILKE